MSHVKREGLVVARKPGTRLLLAGGHRMGLAFEGPSHRTIFFARETVETELKRLQVPLESVDLRPATLEMQLG